MNWRDSRRGGPAVSRRDLVVGMAAISIAAASPVRAQDWPGGAVTIIVPYTPGGAADTLI